MVDDKFVNLIAKYLSGDITLQEKAALLSWLEEDPANKALYSELTEVWSLSEQYEEQYETDTKVAWEQLQAKIDSPNTEEIEEVKIVRFSFRKKWLRVAVAILLLFSVGYWWNNWPVAISQNDLVYLQSSNQGAEMHVLPDGTKVWLNDSTTLTYDRQFEPRNVMMVGEAFFEVEQDSSSPFQIITEQAATEVLGTAFNIRAYPEEERVEVTVEKGKVALKKVQLPNEKVILEKGKTGYYVKEKKVLKISDKKNQNAQAWRVRELVIDNATIQEVEIALERYFDVEIHIQNPDLMNCPYTTGTYIDPDLDAILAQLAFALDMEVKKSNDRYELVGGRCE